MEDDPLCQADYVELRDGDSESSPLVGRFCGSNGPMIRYGTTNKFWVKFHTDGKVQKRGFEATWTKVKQTERFHSEGSENKESQPLPSPSRKFMSKSWTGSAVVPSLSCALTLLVYR